MEASAVPPQRCNASHLLPGFGASSIFGGQSQFSLLYVVSLVLVCNFACALLRRFSIPRLVSEALFGFIIAKLLNAVSPAQFEQALRLFGVMLRASMNGYMFILGLETDSSTLFLLNREAILAYSGLFPTIVLAYFTAPFLDLWSQGFPPGVFPKLGLSAVLSGTASPLLTRMITDLKIGKSDIGRFAVAAGVRCDFVSVVLQTITYIFTLKLTEALKVVVAMAVQIVFTAKFGTFFMTWVNDTNPAGKPIHDSMLVLSVAFVAAIYTWLTTFNLFYPYSAFMTGLFLPREGRVSKTMIRKVNFFLSSVAYPLLFVYLGSYLHLSSITRHWRMFWVRLFLLYGTVLFFKVLGSLVAGVTFGFHWRDGAIVGLFLAVKGHPHVYTMIVASEANYIDPGTFLVMVIVIALTLAYVPFLGADIIDRARKRTPIQLRALQWQDPSTELRVMVCLRGPENVPSVISFMEISRGKPEPGVVVFATDMIELREGVAATVVRGEEPDAVSVSDKSMAEMRRRIGDEIQAYMAEHGNGITLRRMLAVATMSSMHQDICVQAEDLTVSLIVLPFHKSSVPARKSDDGHAGFRYMNRMVLRQAPCSVGILVDRGFGYIGRSSRPSKAGLIFIGGKDDREALAYAGRVARHPGVRLTVIRFMVDTSAEGGGASQRAGKQRLRAAEYEREMKLDDECFADFYERHVVEGRVSYVEKYLANSSEAFAALHALGGEYGLFIVGRGGRVNSVLTQGMRDWEQCAELGPIGDILSGPNFSPAASILIVQQYCQRGKLDGLDDDFSIM